MSKETSFKKELINLFNSIGINEGQDIYATGNISKFARARIPKEQILKNINEALRSSIGHNGTIFSPAASMNLCNTSVPFDLKDTPSHEMGPLAEYLRKQTNTLRSFHPFWSVCGRFGLILGHLGYHLGFIWVFFGLVLEHLGPFGDILNSFLTFVTYREVID